MMNIVALVGCVVWIELAKNCRPTPTPNTGQSWQLTAGSDAALKFKHV